MPRQSARTWRLALLLALCAVTTTALAQAPDTTQPRVPWNALTPAEQQALEPVHAQWDQASGSDQA
ncbi:MAG: hypothetical protein ABI082_08580, partial [Dokdonella sp.]